MPGRTEFIYCLWPRAGAARGLHKFSAAEPFPSFPTPNAVSIPGVSLPEGLHQTLGEPPPVVWEWRRRDGQGAPLACVQLHPSFTLPPQGEEDGGERGRHLCPRGRKGLELSI